MIASIAGDVIALFLGLLGITLGVAGALLKVLFNMRDRLTKLETRFEEHYWHDKKED